MCKESGSCKSHGKVGKSQERRKNTVLPVTRDNTCPFRFLLGWDSNAIYLVCGSGCSHHKNHPKMIPKEMLSPSRLLATPDKLTLKQLGGAYANCGIGRNFIFKNKEGNFVSRSQVRSVLLVRHPFLFIVVPERLLWAKIEDSHAPVDQ